MSESNVPDTGHEYDGIREHDNRLPAWWLITLYGAIAFSFVYWLYFHTFDVGAGPAEAFAVVVQEEEAKARAREAKAAGDLSDEALLASARDAATVARGREVYMANCFACHGDKGQGTVGPNLTDAYWLHGHRPTDQLKIVNDGFIAKGMLAWKPILGPAKVRDVVVFLQTLRDTNAPGKPPEGLDAAGAAPAGTAAPAPPTAPAAAADAGIVEGKG